MFYAAFDEECIAIIHAKFGTDCLGGSKVIFGRTRDDRLCNPRQLIFKFDAYPVSIIAFIRQATVLMLNLSRSSIGI
jgi:hypothetical protein